MRKKHYFNPTMHQHSVQNNLVEDFWMELLHFLIRHSQQPWHTKKSFWNSIGQGLRDGISFAFKIQLMVLFFANSEHRTRVIDDESDYFNADSNKWLNPKQRDALRTKEKELRDSRHGSRRQIKVTLDFAGI